MNAWDKWPDESPEAFRAFEAYLYDPDRILPSESSLAGRNNWSSAHTWVARAGEFDAEMRKRRNAMTAEVIKERATDVAMNADELLQTQFDQAFADPLDFIDEFDPVTGKVTLKPLKDIPVQLRRVMFKGIKLRSNPKGEMVVTAEILSQNARQKALTLLGENKALWHNRGGPDNGAESFGSFWGRLMDAVENGQVDKLVAALGTAATPPIETQAQEVQGVPVREDEETS